VKYGPLPPAAADADLAHMDNERLLKECRSLTMKLAQEDAWRVRLYRAFRILRERKVPRTEIGAVAGMSASGVRLGVDAINRREAEASKEGDHTP